MSCLLNIATCVLLFVRQMLAINAPHVLQANLERPGPERIAWQVIFLPADCVPAPAAYTALCPFTGVRATAPTIPLAAYAWVKEARRRFPDHIFSIPKYILTTRKVWYGEDTSHPGEAVFAVDLHPVPKVVGFVPQRDALIEVREGLPVEASPLAVLETRLRASGAGIDEAAWAEFRVSCTPFMFSNSTGMNARLLGSVSLTPHCLN